MARAVIITDAVIFENVGSSRYIGPYVVASEARKHNHEVTVIDYFTRLPDPINFFSKLITAETNVVAFSSTFLAPSQLGSSIGQRSDGVSQFFSGELWLSSGDQLNAWLAEFKKWLASIAPNCFLVLGGGKSQYALWRPEYYKYFDYIFMGRGEQNFAEFLNLIDQKKPISYDLKNGIKFFVASSPPTNHCPQAFFERHDGIQKNESLPLELARGCSFNCKFCHYNKNGSTRKDVNKLREELVRNFELFETTTYSFCDDCFNDNPNKVKSFCEMFLSLPFKIEWVAYARVDVAINQPWTVDLMIESGARGLFWGIESFDQEVARRAGKGARTEQVKELLFKLKDKFSQSCITEISLITGLPGETTQSLSENLDWILKQQPADLVSVGSLGLTPYVESFDKILIDYAEYSRNPGKYGFQKVQFKPDYWEHDTMNLDQAKDWATRYRTAIDSAKAPTTIRSIWLFPHLRSLGFSKNEIFSMIRQPCNVKADLQQIQQRLQQHLNSYWNALHCERNTNNSKFGLNSNNEL